MVDLHHQAMIEVLANREPPRTFRLDAMKRAGIFFAESMSPYEMTHRAFGEANEALRHMNEALEEEVKRIAHALHDEAGQLLAAVHLSLDQVTRDVDASAQERLREVKGLLEEVDQQMRHLSHELRPTILDDLGLVPAIEFLSEGVAKRSGLRISFRSSKGNRLPAPLETTLYRVVQEALNNVAKHARATSVKIRLRSSGKTVYCSIVDDGVGFNPRGSKVEAQERGFGLLGMREKLQPLGGALRIESAPGQGTKLSIAIPREV
jgi:signal transduction histidine kinase